MEVPSTLGQLKQLQALVLCDNQIESLPSNIANLFNLKSLLLHKNKLRTLPPEIIALKNLNEVNKTEYYERRVAPSRFVRASREKRQCEARSSEEYHNIMLFFVRTIN